MLSLPSNALLSFLILVRSSEFFSELSPKHSPSLALSLAPLRRCDLPQHLNTIISFLLISSYVGEDFIDFFDGTHQSPCFNPCSSTKVFIYLVITSQLISSNFLSQDIWFYSGRSAVRLWIIRTWRNFWPGGHSHRISLSQTIVHKTPLWSWRVTWSLAWNGNYPNLCYDCKPCFI